MTELEDQKLKQKAYQIRRDILDMLRLSGSGHPGGSLSAVDILVYLYEKELKVDPSRPHWTERDRFIASKGHCAPALYAVLADRGFFPRKELWTLRQFGSILQGHPDMLKVPGVDLSTGSLGLGLSAGLGMALAAKMDRDVSSRIYVLLGDGELDEGQNWEAAMAAAAYGADNLTAIVDYNGVQLDGLVDDIMPLGNLQAKFAAFGWRVINACGHDFPSLETAFGEAKGTMGLPSVILAATVKGKGVAMMEGQSQWHGKPIDEELYQQAVQQLEKGAGL